jgi:NAD(P)H dehydrogenase (quinone)
MKTKVIFYSKTGNTESVAKRIATVLNADLERIYAVSDDPNIYDVELMLIPDVKDVDHVILGSPVHGFSVSKIMNAYLNQLPDLKGKTIDLFITHFFPFAWMGGSRSLKQMKSVIEYKGGTVRHMVSINWKNRKREVDIINMISSFNDVKDY